MSPQDEKPGIWRILGVAAGLGVAGWLSLAAMILALYFAAA